MQRNITSQFLNYFFVSVLFFNASCAAIFSGTTQTVRLKTYPEGAQVYHNGNDVSQQTPSKLQIRRAVNKSPHNRVNEQVYTFKKDGYEDLTIRDKSRVNSLALIGDVILLPLLFPIIVDFATGSIYKYNKNIRANMKKAKPSELTVTVKQAEEEVSVEEPKPSSKKETSISIASSIPEAKEVNEDAVAVVIGNNQYGSDLIPNVEFANNDAALMKKYLMRTFGYREGNIIYLENATLADFQRVFGNANNHRARLYNLVKPNESDVFIYYSGHGAPSLNNNQGYMIPADCKDISLIEFEGYPLSTLFNNIGQIPYRSMTLVLDACFSGVTEKGSLINNASPVYIKNDDKLFSDSNATIFASCQNDQISSWHPEEEHSLFTYFFLKGIQGAANTDSEMKALNFSELRNYLIETVPYQARRIHNRTQIPEINGTVGKQLVIYK